ncbi:MAG: hypothetical protein ACI805_002137, partial [Candidatus Azotimanducaceae bacterium]
GFSGGSDTNPYTVIWFSKRGYDGIHHLTKPSQL